MVKFEFLAQFPVDHLPYAVMSSLILLLCYFATFTYSEINHFVFVTTSYTLAILLHIITFCFNIIGLYGIVFCYYEKGFSFTLKVFLLVAMSRFLTPICHLKYPYCWFSFHFCFHVFVVYTLWDFHTSVSNWSFTGVWASASLLRAPGLSEYSCQSQQCCGLDGIDSSSNFLFHQSILQALGDC